ncbi:MAG: hypothetical protein ACR2NS_09955 [Gemmatimonadaceae bacterium]
MKLRWSVAAGASVAGLLACGNDRTTGPAGQEAFTHYVAIGTSLSMGVQSDGVVYFDPNAQGYQEMANATRRR